MIDDISSATHPAVSPRLTALRGKIGLICHTIRWLAVGYALFDLWGLYAFWSDPAKVARAYASFYKLDISGASPAQYALGAGTTFVVWLVLAALCWNVWRLFGRYLRGDIFSRDSAAALQRIGFMGLFTVALDFAMRPVTVYVMSMYLADTSAARHGFIRAEDVLYILISLVFVALGVIYKSAAEIADEHAQIV